MYAFPNVHDPKTGTMTHGMTLRDYFAAQALPTILAAGGVIDAEYFFENAKLAYEQADEMLKARDL